MSGAELACQHKVRKACEELSLLNWFPPFVKFRAKLQIQI